ncbi:MAG: glycosyltransferase family 4 protein [Chitinophagaceae bacterium]
MRILFVHNGSTRFVQIDLALLRERHQVTELYVQRTRLNPIRIAQQVKAHDLVLGWFASWHTFIPVLLAQRWHKPSLVMVGGYDTANVPEAGYGSQRGGLRRLIANIVINKASHLLPFSESARRELLINTGVDPQKITVLYIGVPEQAYDLNIPREKLVLTVGGVWQENLVRKGLLPFVQTAHHLPDHQFVVAGRWFDESIKTLRRAASHNVTFTGFLPGNDLLALYSRATVYVQASLHEGFGMSVAEAMLAGCVPVVTRVGSLPEVVGDTGVYANSVEPIQLAQAITEALAATPVMRLNARARVLACFSLEKRRQRLLNILQNV